MKIRSFSTFRRALWAGLAAPAALYAAPPVYPVYSAANSVPQAFAEIGASLSGSVRRHRDEASRKHTRTWRLTYKSARCRRRREQWCCRISR